MNQVIKKVLIRDNRILNVPDNLFIKTLKGNFFKSTKRHGKYLFIELKFHFLVLHFGMTGDLLYFNNIEQEPLHSRILIEFENGNYLSYINQRMFGKVDLISSIDDFIKEKKLGPDALFMNYDDFKKTLRRKSAITKTALMDQSIIAGIGNIYSDEILFQANIHPKTKINQIDEPKLKDLFNMIKKVLEFGIVKQGDLDTYPDEFLIPHRKKNDSCPRCGTMIERYEHSGRHGFFCSSCQKKIK
jgi:formamidopyrimidine-DNA glycosylase